MASLSFKIIISELSLKPPSSVVAVIVTASGNKGVTKPSASTVAILGSLELQVTFLLVAFSGDTVAVICRVSLRLIVSVVGETVIPSTATGSPVTSMSNVFSKT